MPTVRGEGHLFEIPVVGLGPWHFRAFHLLLLSRNHRLFFSFLNWVGWIPYFFHRTLVMEVKQGFTICNWRLSFSPNQGYIIPLILFNSLQRISQMFRLVLSSVRRTEENAPVRYKTPSWYDWLILKAAENMRHQHRVCNFAGSNSW